MLFSFKENALHCKVLKNRYGCFISCGLNSSILIPVGNKKYKLFIVFSAEDKVALVSSK